MVQTVRIDSLSCSIFSAISANYETEYLYGGLLYTQNPITEHLIIRHTIQVATGLVYVYDYDEYGKPIDYHCEVHTLVSTYGHTVNNEHISLAHTYDLNETETELQGDVQLENLGHLL